FTSLFTPTSTTALYPLSLHDALPISEVRDGDWRLLDCQPAGEGHPTHEAFVAFAWDGPEGERLVAVVNYGPAPGQCHVRLPWPRSEEHTSELQSPDHLVCRLLLEKKT